MSSSRALHALRVAPVDSGNSSSRSPRAPARLLSRMAPLPLATRLGLTHGILASLVFLVLIATMQGLVRMVGLISDIRDEGLSSVDAEESIHRAAWAIEVTVRHGRIACSKGSDGRAVRDSLVSSRDALVRHRASHPQVPQALLHATAGYLELANASTTGDTCAYLLLPETDAFRARLDEELTNAWIDRIHDVHANLEHQEDAARQIGVRTATIGLVVAIFCAVAAVLISRTTARSVTAPIAELARAATRLGEGDFRPIPPPRGPREVEELWRDLDVMRGRLLELDRMKTAFLANVSHELRSPLTRVRAALSLLSDGTCGPLSDQQKGVLALASRACEREVRIVTALLDMSRLDSGLPLKVESGGDIDRVLSTIVDEERSEATEREVGVTLELEGEAPHVAIDSALVERALANLVRNAVSVSNAGQSVRVRRVLRREEDGRKFVAVEVIDDGPGLPEEVRKASFRPFAAANVSEVSRPAGIGLGLSLAHEVARAHLGELVLVRSDSTGTMFRFELPLVDPKPKPIGKEKAREADEPA